MARKRTSGSRRLKLLAWGVLGLFVCIVVLDFAVPTYVRKQTQLDLSSGRERTVLIVLGSKFAGAERDTFASRRLAGETIADEPNWKPLDTSTGILIMPSSLWHTRWQYCWYDAQRLERSSWQIAGFSEEARTESVRRLLLSLSADQGKYPNPHYLRLLDQIVEEALKHPLRSVTTDVSDLPLPHERLPARN
jgi:hypothetical protein